LLQGERVALNLLQRMSGVATLTARYVSAVQGTKTRIVDTRKTTPGLRVLEKYAVRVGGGSNHRTGLYDGVLIKENHIAAAGGITEAIRRTRSYIPHTLKIEIETESLAQVKEALAAGADIIMLDNMAIPLMQEAVGLINGRALVEASGGVNLDTVRAIAETGVDIISVGALTHSAPAMDISMLLEAE
jgi:nicotinate-nucleotide pyrophosphorylase (carboxylating)